MNNIGDKLLGSADALTTRWILIVVPKWPSGTMAFKLGSAIMSALNVDPDSAALVQFVPERIFKVQTNISKEEFQAKLKSSGLPDAHRIEFYESNQ